MGIPSKIVVIFIALSVLSCGEHQPLVRNQVDEATGKDLRCEGLDWGGTGVPHGLWHCFWPSGALHSQGRYSEGIRDGLWRYFDEDGREISKELWEKGKVKWSLFSEDQES